MMVTSLKPYFDTQNRAISRCGGEEVVEKMTDETDGARAWMCTGRRVASGLIGMKLRTDVVLKMMEQRPGAIQCTVEVDSSQGLTIKLIKLMLVTVEHDEEVGYHELMCSDLN